MNRSPLPHVEQVEGNNSKGGMMRRVRHVVAAGAVAVGAIAIGDAGPVEAEHRALTATLLGRNEVPDPGDPDGFGVAGVLINTDTGRICYAVAVARIEPATLAHIHRGTAVQAGPVVVNFQPPSRGFKAACTSADPALAREIVGNPSGFYVNVHNNQFQGGAVRGQLR